jgi:hypothetical protein
LPGRIDRRTAVRHLGGNRLSPQGAPLACDGGAFLYLPAAGAVSTGAAGARRRGESVGFFRFDEVAARRLAAIVAGYADSGRGHMPHEEAARDLLQERSQKFEVADVTGSPWIEIDFPNDVVRAAHEVLPQL